MADVFAVLAADHRRIFELTNELTGGAGRPGGSPKQRKRIATRLVIEESKHEALEEMLFWPVVAERVEGGAALVLAGQTQEQVAKRLLNEIEHMSPGNDEFATAVDRIASALRDHITFEESQVWPKLQLRLGGEAAIRLGDDIEQRRPTAPTRPHPNAPASAGLLRSLGPSIAALDRARDGVTGRGRH